jgi:hypothetical protein
MSNIMAGSLNGAFPNLSVDNKLEVVSLLINNACNLSCRHCYLQTKPFGNYLTHNEWMKLLASIFGEIKPSILCFAGKEVFINEQSVSILLDAVKLRNSLQISGNRRTQIGVITNGTLLQNFRDKLATISPDYFDVSIDGLPDVHDHVRGEGAFNMLEPNLHWLSLNYPGRVWVTHTLLESNMRTLPEFIRFYHAKFNIHNFSIGFYKNMRYTDQSLKIATIEYYEIVDDIFPRLGKIAARSPINVNMEFDVSQEEIIDTLTAAGWADPVKPIASVAHEFDNGLTLRINTTRIPVGLWRAARITPEGYWLAAEDLIRVKEYNYVVVAKARDFDFDAVKLYREGLKRKEKLARKEIIFE